MYIKLSAIADDFTGANDTGIQCNKSGLTVDVSLDFAQPYQGGADVVIVNTNGRVVVIENAQEQIKYFRNPFRKYLPVLTKAGGLSSLGVLQNTIDFIHNINEGVYK